MAVLVEGISVVIRNEAITSGYEGGMRAFAAEVPNLTLCSDGELTRVGFTNPVDVKAYVQLLERRGLRYVEQNAAVDLVVVDQRSGFLAKCSWAGFGHSAWPGAPERRVAVCYAIPTAHADGIVVPETWKYEGSLSEQHRFVETDKLDETMKFLRHEEGVDVYLDPDTGKELYVGRSGAD